MPAFIQVQEVSKRYGPLVVFEGACGTFYEGQKIGVIGRNGAGKTTLCRFITREEEPDSGSVARSPDARLGYLEQVDTFDLDETPLSFLLRRSGKPEWACGRAAARFRIPNDWLHAPIRELSGGFRTRVKLAALILLEPNLLVLDEPTNYLDLQTVILLEAFLRSFSGGLLLVSHDREFLKRTCSMTLEVDRGGLELYPGDIEAHFARKEEERLHAERHNRKMETRRRQLQNFVDRHRANAKTASQAQNKLKQLRRLETIEIEHPMRSVRFRIPFDGKTGGGPILRTDGLDVGYGRVAVARDIGLEVARGEKVAVLGENGQGKTTLLRTLARDLEPLQGEVRWAQGTRIAYYAQHLHGMVPPGVDVETYLTQMAATGTDRQAVMDMAGRFLFHGDDVRKKASVLSGGERARLCLAGILLQKRDALLLDEPTNHLDFETVEVLAEALRSYGGTVFFVSHDRTFVSRIATQVVEVKQGRVIPYPATYEDYVWRLCQEAGDEPPSKEPERAEGGDRRSRKDAHQRRKELRREISRLRDQSQKLEAEIAGLQAEKQGILDAFLKNPTDPAPERTRRLAEVEQTVARMETNWYELLGRVEEMERSGGGS